MAILINLLMFIWNQWFWTAKVVILWFSILRGLNSNNQENLFIAERKAGEVSTKGDAEKNKYIKIIDDFKAANKILKGELREKDKDIKQLCEEKKQSEKDQDGNIDKQVGQLGFGLEWIWDVERKFDVVKRVLGFHRVRLSVF